MSDDSWARCYHRPMLGLLLVLAAFPALQQSTPATGTAEIVGKVITRSGTPLPGAIITLEAPPPATVQAIVSGEGGAFRFRNIPPGTYTVKFERADTVTYSRTGLVLAAGQTKTLNVALEVGP